MTSMPTNEDNLMTSRPLNNPDDDFSYNSGSSDTNFPDDVWMDDKDNTPSNSFLGKIFEKKKESSDDVFNVVSNRAMLETEVWKTQMAINDELIEASVTEREEKIKRTIKYEELLEENKQLRKIKSENEAHIENLMKENTLMKKNICSLYKTAKAESERKDKMMLEMNKELDSLRRRIKIKSLTSSWENNYNNMHDGKLNGRLRNDKACNEAMEVKPTSSASRRENTHIDKKDDKVNNDVRNNKTCNKAQESKVTKSKEEKSTSHQSSHKSRDDVNRINDSRKRKRESPYKSYSKYRHSYNDRRKTAEKSSYSYYKRSYGYHSVSPRKVADKRDIKKYVRTSHVSNVDSKRRTSKMDDKSSKANIKGIDQSKTSPKPLNNRTGIHRKGQDSVYQKISNKKNNNFYKNAETNIECSDNNLLVGSRKIVDPICSESFQRQDKMFTDVAKDLSKILNSEFLPSTELQPTSSSITVEVHVPPKIYVAEECGSLKKIVDLPSSVDANLSTTPGKSAKEVPALSESVPAEVSALLESVAAEVSASHEFIAAELSASHIPVATEMPVAGDNTEDTTLLQNVDSKICCNNDIDSIEQNVSCASSNCELINDSECNLNSKNKCVDILEDKTTTNALFFGLLPIEIRRSFMEYEQQLIVNTNKLKQSFVNYYFKHYEGIGPSTHKDEVTSNNEQCSVNQTTSHNKDVYSPLFFFDEKNKMALSINSNISPKTLSVDETNNNKLVIPKSVSQVHDIVQKDPSLFEGKTKGDISDNEDVHSDSTKEIDIFHLDVIQKQLDKNSDMHKDLPGVLNVQSSTTLETVAVKLSSAPVTVPAKTSTMPISVASEVTTLPTSISVEMPNPSASVAVELPALFASNAAKVSESADAEVPTSPVSIVAEVPASKLQTRAASAAEAPYLVAEVQVPSLSVVTKWPATTSNISKSDIPVSHAKQKSPSELQICYREVPQESYPQCFNSVYSRRQLVKTALKEQEEDGLTKSTKEDLEKLYRYRNDKKPFVIWRKAKLQKET